MKIRNIVQNPDGIQKFINDCVLNPTEVVYNWDIDLSQFVLFGYKVNIVLPAKMTTLPYNISKCDDFILDASHIASWHNMPKQRFYTYGQDISISLESTTHLDMKQLSIEYPHLTDLTLIAFDNFDLHDLFNIKIDDILVLKRMGQQKIYDLSNYENINSKILEFSDNEHKFNNLQYVLLCDNIKMFFINACLYYTPNQIDELRKIIHHYIHKDNRKEHVMDFCVELIDAGFEYETT